MTSSNNHTDFLSLLKSGDAKAFELIYELFADKLYHYVNRRVNNKEISEDIVQEIFVSLWSKRESLEITNSLDAYLFGAAKFQILTYIRSNQVCKEYADNFMLFNKERTDNSTEEMMNLKDLQHNLNTSISELPEKCRTAIHMSRIKHEPISRIAEHMNISKRTVENYLSHALKHLRTSLGEFLTVLMLWIFR